jgi:two-component system sensor histidine kinase YesM
VSIGAAMNSAGKPFVSMFLKLFLVLTSFSLLMFTGLLYSGLTDSREALILQKSEDMTLLNERTEQYLDLYLQNIRNIMLNVSGRLDREILTSTNKLSKMLRDIAELNTSIVSNLFILRLDGTVVSSNQLLYNIISHPELSRSFRIANENPGVVNWSQPYYSPLLVDQTISFALTLKDEAGFSAGVVLAEINTPQLIRQFSQLLKDSGQSFVLFTEQGQVLLHDRESSILPYKHGTIPHEIDTQFAEGLFALHNGVSRIEGSHGYLIAVKSSRNQLGWYLVSLTDERTFEKHARLLYNRFIGIGILYFLLLLVLAFVISRHFTTPIKRLALQMDRIRGERLATPLSKVERNDEIGWLSISFYTMIERIQELLNMVREIEGRKKTMELKMLLSQIRPHFLYNTLACIASLAKQHRVNEVEETIRSLILMLTYSIDKKQEFVMLKEEIETLEAYMQIQRVRYGDHYKLEIDIPPAYMAAMLPKLILQPLVENAIFHGLAVKGEGTIRVGVVERDGHLLISVFDDGVGMNEQQIDEVLHRKIAEQDIDHLRIHNVRGLNSIGLSNVLERIRLNFGEQYGLSIDSEPGEFCIVTVELPFTK